MSARYNFDGRSCPRCYRESSLLIRAGLYECLDGCGARFKFVPATDDAIASLIHVFGDAPEQAGARMADDVFCRSCGARGSYHCMRCSAAESREAGR